MRVAGIVMASLLVAGPATAQTAPAPAPPPTTYRGAPMTIDAPRTPVVDALRTIADVGGASIVTIDVPPDARIDLRADGEPWDQVLDRVVAAAGLKVARRGAVYVIASPAAFAAYAKEAPRSYRGPRITVDVDGIDAASAARLLAVGGGAPFELAPASATVRLRLRNVPLDQARDLLALHAGAAPVARPARVPPPRKGTCAAADVPPDRLALRGLLQRGATRHALLVASGAPVVVGTGACVGAGGAKVTAITASSVTLTVGTTATTLELGARATSAAGSFGSGGLGMRGTGETDGVPSGGIGRIGVGAAHPRGGTLALEPPTASPGLAPDIIRRIIKQNANRLRFCYEQALVVTPGLTGALAVAFTIGPDGRVTAASATGLGDSVGGCVTTVLRGLAFPRPERGLSVTLSYPMRGTPAPDPTR